MLLIKVTVTIIIVTFQMDIAGLGRFTDPPQASKLVRGNPSQVVWSPGLYLCPASSSTLPLYVLIAYMKE